MKNKVLSIVLMIALMSSMAGCGNRQSGSEADSAASSESASSRMESTSSPETESAQEEAQQIEQDVDGSDSLPENDPVDEESVQETKVYLMMGDIVLTVNMRDNATAEDFLSLLPLTLELQDEMNREKYRELPRKLDESGPRQETFEIGDFAYWPNGPGLVMFYDDHITSLHGTSIIVLGTIDENVEVLADVVDPVEVTITLGE